MIVEQHQSGLLDCLGQMWTWVGGEAEAVVTGTLIGVWANVIDCQSSNRRIDCQSSNQRIET